MSAAGYFDFTSCTNSVYEFTKTALSKGIVFYTLTITYKTICQILHFPRIVRLVLTKKLLFLIYSFIIAYVARKLDTND